MTLINKRDIFSPIFFSFQVSNKVERKNPQVNKVKLLTINLQMIYSKTPKLYLIRSHLFNHKKIHKYTVVDS